MKRGVLAAAVLGAAIVAGNAAPARAGAIGDAVVAVGDWIGEVEAATSAWLERLWGRVSTSGRSDRAADAFRRLAVESPDRLDNLAGRAGYALAGYAVSRNGGRNLVLRFRHDRDLAADERRVLSRELTDPAALDVQPELELVGILLDAADWRDANGGGRFNLTGVEVVVDDGLSSTLIFSEPSVNP